MKKSHFSIQILTKTYEQLGDMYYLYAGMKQLHFKGELYLNVIKLYIDRQLEPEKNGIVQYRPEVIGHAGS